MFSALNGVKILDLTRVLAGPYCTMILGDLGAQVIKVEAPGGSDETRGWGPPFQNGVSAYYLCANRNKKSITIDLKTDEGKKIIQKLISECDVIINNFKTGTMDRLGLGYESLAKINPKIIFCSITGFGETGPYKHLPGYDFIIQAMSGFMSITGEEDSTPQKVGVAITDVLTGLYACIGIHAALYEREQSGTGQKIDVSLYDTAVSSLVNIASNYLMSGKIPTRLGNRHPNIVPYQTFQTADGEMVIAVGNDRQFAHLCSIIGLPELSQDPQFSTNPNRVTHRETLIPILQNEFIKKPTAYWQQLCQQNTIPCGPIQSMEDLVADPQLQAREMFLSMNHPEAGDIRLVGSPLKLSKTPPTFEKHPPMPGEHTEEILTQLGYSAATIADLQKNQII
ncbi:crotonobetainyl-CoA:carnitine CoA-transferase CaiB-like acyl-CoA transferase [Oikeobacillus pervagus]|uniref:Crotonobetainyl-CoA:carnitine CoA-transferase CaiB-like acyl-CoA transferase n=1 Tax=Oikeobacillus pervagus TaxID=1325931 RepID=A0AAJ1SVU4_9BACI|nr:CoA transferase [Oikeobacillus pervagus]MDQ0213788.1 crotonobetainyl-CoA:carnitine CoA-transferase CaiB-like acyl-CoA transferase [Oikeobacillus pervagus]